MPVVNKTHKTNYEECCFPTKAIKHGNIIIDRQNVFHQPITNNLITYNNIHKIATDQRDDYINGCFLDYDYFKKYCKMLAIHLSKQQVLQINPKAKQQITFAENLKSIKNIFHY